MGSRLNVKSQDAYRLASRVAELTGESLTNAVTNALRSELKRLESGRDIDAEAERMPAIRMDARGGAYAGRRFDDFLKEFRIETVPFTADNAREARRAR